MALNGSERWAVKKMGKKGVHLWDVGVAPSAPSQLDRQEDTSVFDERLACLMTKACSTAAAKETNNVWTLDKTKPHSSVKTNRSRGKERARTKANRLD